MHAPEPPRPGLIVLHGNRLEQLYAAVAHCLERWPLGPIEDETLLVQSHAAGEWFRMRQAAERGVCAALRVELPGRFLWGLYRRVLGAALPPQSALDKRPLRWRLLRLLPGLLDGAGFEAMARYCGPRDEARLDGLARELADLFDQYQVYRPGWLRLWAQGVDAVDDAHARRVGLAREQAWQPALWRALLADLGSAEQHAQRALTHERVLARLRQHGRGAAALPRRVILFGASSVPQATLQALDALSQHAQVIVAVFNPCRYHWSDLVDGGETLRAIRRRSPLRGGLDLSTLPVEHLHEHANPLLAAWGRQGRDFMRQLDALDRDDSLVALLGAQPTGIFDDAPGETLLQQVQAAVRDMVPTAELGRRSVPASDRSIVFQVAHGRQREVEILHDQLLDLLRDVPGLAPRDIVVMAPDIAAFAPHVRAVFAQYRRDDPRFIPWSLADRSGREFHPLVGALQWLLRLDGARITTSEMLDLLDQPSIAARFSLAADELPVLARWLHGAGVRWGLDAEQRGDLGLQTAGEQGSWSSGLDRLVLGYASGDDEAFEQIPPYAEVGGLEARLVGVVAELLGRLRALRAQCRVPAPPSVWAQRARGWLDEWFEPVDETERMTLAAMSQALDTWEGECALARLDADVGLGVFRQAWLEALDGVAAGGRFFSGGVTLCSLMPLRSVPFRVVCLIGMNDGDYPRDPRASDFDLLRLAGMARPGDRSRADDDRYLMLEALLSARQVFSVSWSGRSARDNSESPPSLLVSQLRDYLAAGWRAAQPDAQEGPDLLGQRTTVHALQPFSRSYFGDGPLHSHAVEWHAAHATPPQARTTALEPLAAARTLLGLRDLSDLLRNPVRLMLRARLGVDFEHAGQELEDDEPFVMDRLAQHTALRELVRDPAQLADDAAQSLLRRRVAGLAAASALPFAAPGRQAAQELLATARTMLGTWSRLRRGLGAPVQPAFAGFTHAGLRLENEWRGLLHADGELRWLDMTPSRLCQTERGRVRPYVHKLLAHWVRQVVGAACGQAGAGWLIGSDHLLYLPAPDAALADACLREWMQLWPQALCEPLPWAPRSALAQLSGGAAAARVAYESPHDPARAEAADPYLSRVYPDFSCLAADGRFADHARRLFAPLAAWADEQVRVFEHDDAAALEQVRD